MDLPVPPFVTVTAAAGEDDAALADDLRAAAEAALAGLGADSFAVRSSLVGEDAAAVSHAGQLRSLLAVRRERVWDAVLEVERSARSEQVMRYRARQGLALAGMRMAVVIQAMIDARAAGVAFTIDPVSGAPAQLVVAGLGLGEGVVADRVPIDTFRRALGALAWQREVRPKLQRVAPRTDGDWGTELAAADPDRSGHAALSAAELERFGALLERIAEGAALPQDVEWAVDHAGKVWILQARPVTVRPSAPLEIWDDSNVGESYPGLTRALTYSVVRETYERLFRLALREVGTPAPTLAALQPNLARLLGLIHGRLYFNVGNYHALFAAVPGLSGTARAWRAALGIEDAGPDERVPSSLAARAATWARLARRYRANDRAVSACLRANRELLARWGSRPLEGRDGAALLADFRTLHGELLPTWTAIIYNDYFLFLLVSWLDRVIGGEGDLGRRLLTSGAEGTLASVEAARSLAALLELARATPEVQAVLEQPASPRDQWDRLHRTPGIEPFLARLEQHLDLHGHCAVAELKLETDTPAVQPWLLLPVLGRALTPTAQTPAQPSHTRQEAERALGAHLAAHPVRLAIAGWLLPRVRAGIRHRENLSHARTRAFGLARRLFRAAGLALVREGVLRAPEQVLDLTIEELTEWAAGGGERPALDEIAAVRREQYAGYTAERAPHRIVVGSLARKEAPVARAAPAPGTEVRLCGIPCSPGIARGPARVLIEPAGNEDTRGAIIVAEVTDPGWLALMLQARGLVIERGNVLSHAAIVGRELGLPTVVGVENATQRIRTGDEIEVDGGTGEVRLLSR